MTTTHHPQLWLIADMDGTLIPTPNRCGGERPCLSSSPTCTPLLDWLRDGNALIVNTTAATRTIKQVWQSIPVELRKNVYLAICSGAAILECGEDGQPVEIATYRQSTLPGGTAIPQEDVEYLMALGRGIVLQLIRDSRTDPSLLPLLSTKWKLQWSALQGLTDAELEATLSMEVLTKDGALEFLKTSNDCVVSCDYIPDTDVVAQMQLGGIPMARHAMYFPQAVRDDLDARGLVLNSQPNSVAICKKGLDKATCLPWLERAAAAAQDPRFATFALTRAVGIADVPHGPDLPLATHPPMLFVSVAVSECHFDYQGNPHTVFVGGEEAGTARFLEHMLRGLATWDGVEASGAPTLRDVVFEAAAAAREFSP